MVQRTIGTKIGTGGSEGAAYLMTTLNRPIFPDLWAIRTRAVVHTLDDLRRTPNALAPHYSRFRVAERLLFTGHSHQAWPDVAFDGQVEAWRGRGRVRGRRSGSARSRRPSACAAAGRACSTTATA